MLANGGSEVAQQHTGYWQPVARAGELRAASWAADVVPEWPLLVVLPAPEVSAESLFQADDDGERAAYLVCS